MAEINGHTEDKAGYVTNHCLCSQLSLATRGPLDNLATRERYGDYIAQNFELAPDSVKVSEKATVLKLDDGFEKRYLVSCARCKTSFGYFLDLEQFEGSNGKSGMREDVLYLLPGILTEIEKLDHGKDGKVDGR
jgi:hypothetical protein